jgi:hypothetical protein
VKISFVRGGKTERLLQKGVRERLLCADCESRISTYEHSFKEFWWGASGLPRRIDPGTPLIHLQGAHFARFKLFHLSVIWRAGVSTFCKAVSLGRYERQLANMIRSGNPGEPDHFPVFGVVLVDDDGTVTQDLITQPVHLRLSHSHAYYMCYAGCEWHFVVTDHPGRDAKVLSVGLQPSGDVFLRVKPWTQAGSVKFAVGMMRDRE